MMGLAVTLNNAIVTSLALLIGLPLWLAMWFMVGFVLAAFLGPLGFVCAFLMMFYYARH